MDILYTVFARNGNVYDRIGQVSTDRAIDAPGLLTSVKHDDRFVVTYTCGKSEIACVVTFTLSGWLT